MANSERITSKKESRGEESDPKTDWDILESEAREPITQEPGASKSQLGGDLPRQNVIESLPVQSKIGGRQSNTEFARSTEADRQEANGENDLASRQNFRRLGQKALGNPENFKPHGHSATEQEQLMQTPMYRALSEYFAQLDAEQTVKPQDFKDIYSERTIENDLYFVKKREEGMIMRSIAGGEAGLEQMRAAKRAERLVVEGINHKNWLGGEAMSARERQSAFRATAEPTARYDDFIHNVDAFVTLDFPCKAGDPEKSPKYWANRPVFGIDVTMSNLPLDIQRKMTRSHRDSMLSLPLGFTSIKYYQHEGKRYPQIIGIPRYVVGLDQESLEKDDDVSNCINRYKILAEMQAQNRLFRLALPSVDSLLKNPPASDSPLRKSPQTYVKSREISISKLSVMDRVVEDALNRTSMEIAERGYLPGRLKRELKDLARNGDFAQMQSIITSHLLGESRYLFRKRYPNKNSHTDTFVGIMSQCRKLENAVRKGEVAFTFSTRPPKPQKKRKSILT